MRASPSCPIVPSQKCSFSLMRRAETGVFVKVRSSARAARLSPLLCRLQDFSEQLSELAL
jgi:hypothetical protein